MYTGVPVRRHSGRSPTAWLQPKSTARSQPERPPSCPASIARSGSLVERASMKFAGLMSPSSTPAATQGGRLRQHRSREAHACMHAQ